MARLMLSFYVRRLVVLATCVLAPAGGWAQAWSEMLSVNPSSTLVSGSVCLFDGKFVRCDGTVATGGLAVGKLDDLSDVEYNLTTGNMFIGTSYTTALVNNTGNTSLGVGALMSLTDDNGDANNGDRNTAIGYGALRATTTGYHNTAVGNSSLTSNTTGSFNSSFGRAALASNVSSSRNNAFGISALFSHLYGEHNVAIGTSTMYANVNGSSNVALGGAALYGVESVTNTVAVGYRAGYGVEGSSAYMQNTFIGAYSGDSVTTGNNNTLLGYNTDTPAATTSNYINIANTIFGDSSTKKVGVGDLTSASLTVSGTLLVKNGGEACDSTFGGAIRYSGGALSYCNGTAWTSLGGAANLSETIALNDLSDVVTNHVSRSMYLGQNAGVVATGVNNTALGYMALASNTTGIENTVVGNIALASNTTGYDNSAFGYGSLHNNITGYANSSFGVGGLFSNTSGTGNAAFGNSSLFLNKAGTGNTALGRQAIYSNSSGSFNVGVGAYALREASSVTNSVVIGYNAGYGVSGLTNYENNIFIGAYSGDGVTTGNNNTLLGYNTDLPTPTTSNYINIANTIFGDSSMKAIGIDTAPVSGVGMAVSGSITYTGTITDVSDRRLKTNIEPVLDGSALERLMLMKPVKFEMKNRRGVTEFGFIAQDVQQIFPELVMVGADKDRTLSLNYVGMIAPMVQSIQELKKENDALKTSVEVLMKRVEALEAKHAVMMH